MFERTTITKLMNPNALVLGVVAAFVFALLLPDISYAQATSGIISSVGTGMEKILWVFVNVLFGWLVWVGGMLLDTAINDYVIGFGTMYTGASGLGFTIDRLWVIVRDIFNLTFIFGLVFIGLRMIFDSSNSSTRKMLIYLILAALLVNFSLFITKFVIDFSNIAAAQIATAFQAGGTGTAQVSGHFMRLMGLTGLLNTGAGAGFNFANMTGGAGLGYILGTMILYIIAAFVFLGGALLLMIRFAVLNIYMVLSPLMFIGWVFPSAAGVTSKYWKGFLSRAFFAPAYLLMLYFAQSILSTFAITAQGASLSSIFTEQGQATFSTVVPPFVLTAVFLIAALVVAQKMGANGADGVLAVGKTLTGKAKQYTKQAGLGVVNAATYAPRVGARAGVNKLGGVALKGFDKYQAKAQIKAQTAIQNNQAGWLTKKVGPASSWNFVDRAARGVTGSAKKAQFGTGTTNSDEETYKAKTVAAAQDRADVMQMSELNGLVAKERATLAQGGQLSAEDQTRLSQLRAIESKLRSSVTSLATSQLEDMSEEMLKSISKDLSNSQVENLMKSDKASSQTKAMVMGARQDAIKDLITTNNTLMTKELGKLSIEQIETMGEEWAANNAALFTKSQMDDLKKSKKFTEYQKSSILQKRGSEQKNLVAANPSSLFMYSNGERRKPEDIANLGIDILTHPNALPLLTQSDVEAIADKKTLTKDERNRLRAEISRQQPGSPLDTYLGTTQAARLGW
jgi:hypothetical protein